MPRSNPHFSFYVHLWVALIEGYLNRYVKNVGFGDTILLEACCVTKTLYVTLIFIQKKRDCQYL